MDAKLVSTPHDLPPGADRDIVGSLQKGLVVMEILARNPAGMTLTETASQAGLTRAGARRLLLTLVAGGYAAQVGRRFVLSARLLSLARSWLEGGTHWTHAEPILREISTTLGESCSAAVLDGEDVVYVARAAGRRILSVSLHVGTHLPAYCTSMGRVLLAGLGEEELTRFLATARIEKNTPKTVTDRRKLAAMIGKVRENGYAVADEELELGLRSIAVPVRDRSGRTVAAINVSTQSVRFTCAEMVETILPHLRGAAARIEDLFALQ
jgi:IclR family pca regulon transcriptional regulator